MAISIKQDMINCDYNFVMRNSFPPINIIGNSSWIYLDILYWNNKKKPTKEIGVFFTSFYFPYISQIQQSTLSTHKGALTQITAAIDNKQSHFVDMDTINYLIVTTRLIQAITVLKR